MSPAITRHYVTVNGLRIHYRKAGQGRPVILFHQSPRSSAEYEDLILNWSREFLIIAPDTPGFGHSDPLPKETPDMMDFANVMAGFVKALNLYKVGLYGFHTGASLASCVTRLIPDRVVVAVAYGLAKLDPAEKDDILTHYLPPFTAQWDGGHLTWLWARIREQATFFPWYKKDDESRMRIPMYDAQKMDAQISDFLLSGDEYRKAYAAAFSFNPDDVLAEVKTPLKIIGAPPDPLFLHLDRLEGYSESCELVAYDNPRKAIEGAFEILKEADYGNLMPEPTLADGAECADRGFVYIEGTRLHYQRAGDNAGRPPVVLLHDLTENAAVRKELIDALSQTRTVIALDLPGHGGSAPLAAEGEAGLETCADLLLAAISRLTADKVELVTCGLAAVIGRRMRARSESIRQHALVDFLAPPADGLENFRKNFLPDLSRTPWGGHLLSGWHFVRSRQLFWPWYEQGVENIIPVTSALAPHRLHRAFVALWQADERSVRILFDEVLNQLGTEDLSAFGAEDRILLPDWVRDSAHVARPAGTVDYYTVELAAALQDRDAKGA